MNDSIRQLLVRMVTQLEDIETGSEFDCLLNCSEPDLREEAVNLHTQINELKSRLESI